MIDLGEQSDINVMNKAFELRGKNIADIGCGDATFAKLIAENGAKVTGVEPDPIQAEHNRHTKLIENLKLIEAGAQTLPFDDGSQDILVFRFSFHHIPSALHAQVFQEAARVLHSSGQLFIIEPLASGPAQYVMELFHDETRVRAEVQVALHTIAPRHFKHVQTYAYEMTRSFASFSAYLDRYANLSYNHYQANSVNNQAVKDRFMEFRNDQGTTDLNQPIKADLFVKHQA